jgi:hypothetical protein
MKFRTAIPLGLLSAAVLGGVMVASANDDNDSRVHDRDGGLGHVLDTRAREILIGFRIAPVALDTHGKNVRLVGLGSYIVNAQGGCNDCHTHPSYAEGGDPHAGQPEKVNAEQYLTGGALFGPVKSSNLTPDADGRPAGLTLEEFIALMRTGRDPDDSNRILQVMPWPVYGKMTDFDLRAIYEYLRAIPSRPDNPSPGA